MKYCLLILLVISLASCSIEKRRYNSGYHVEWFSKVKPDSHRNSFIASIPRISIKSLRQPEISFKVREKEFSINVPTVIASKKNIATAVQPTIEASHSNEKSYYAKKVDETKGAGWSIFIGLVLIVLAVVLYFDPTNHLFPNIAIIAILILGLIAFITGIVNAAMHIYYENKLNAEPVQPKTSGDIVYLKNGSIIHGQVIEMIPDQTIKIQTSDGSIYVYKMDEVLKITREERKK